MMEENNYDDRVVGLGCCLIAGFIFGVILMLVIL